MPEGATFSLFDSHGTFELDPSQFIGSIAEIQRGTDKLMKAAAQVNDLNAQIAIKSAQAFYNAQQNMAAFVARAEVGGGGGGLRGPAALMQQFEHSAQSASSMERVIQPMRAIDAQAIAVARSADRMGAAIGKSPTVFMAMEQAIHGAVRGLEGIDRGTKKFLEGVTEVGESTFMGALLGGGIGAGAMAATAGISVLFKTWAESAAEARKRTLEAVNALEKVREISAAIRGQEITIAAAPSPREAILAGTALREKLQSEIDEARKALANLPDEAIKRAAAGESPDPTKPAGLDKGDVQLQMAIQARSVIDQATKQLHEDIESARKGVADELGRLSEATVGTTGKPRADAIAELRKTAEAFAKDQDLLPAVREFFQRFGGSLEEGLLKMGDEIAALSVKSLVDAGRKLGLAAPGTVPTVPSDQNIEARAKAINDFAEAMRAASPEDQRAAWAAFGLSVSDATAAIEAMRQHLPADTEFGSAARELRSQREEAAKPGAAIDTDKLRAAEEDVARIGLERLNQLRAAADAASGTVKANLLAELQAMLDAMLQADAALRRSATAFALGQTTVPPAPIPAPAPQVASPAAPVAPAPPAEPMGPPAPVAPVPPVVAQPPPVGAQPETVVVPTDVEPADIGGTVDDAQREADGSPIRIPVEIGEPDDQDRMREYAAFFERNKQYVKPGEHQYSTQLAPDQESAFREWLAKNEVPFQPDAATSDYDMRGFYQALMAKDKRATSAIDPNDQRMHYPDYWKTPYHETFSNESQWATKDAPHWTEDDKLVDVQGNIVFDDRAPHEDVAKIIDEAQKQADAHPIEIPGAVVAPAPAAPAPQTATPPPAPTAPPATRDEDTFREEQAIAKARADLAREQVAAAGTPPPRITTDQLNKEIDAQLEDFFGNMEKHADALAERGKKLRETLDLMGKTPPERLQISRQQELEHLIDEIKKLGLTSAETATRVEEAKTKFAAQVAIEDAEKKKSFDRDRELMKARTDDERHRIQRQHEREDFAKRAAEIYAGDIKAISGAMQDFDKETERMRHKPAHFVGLEDAHKAFQEEIFRAAPAPNVEPFADKFAEIDALLDHFQPEPWDRFAEAIRKVNDAMDEAAAGKRIDDQIDAMLAHFQPKERRATPAAEATSPSDDDDRTITERIPTLTDAKLAEWLADILREGWMEAGFTENEAGAVKREAEKRGITPEDAKAMAPSFDGIADMLGHALGPLISTLHDFKMPDFVGEASHMFDAILAPLKKATEAQAQQKAIDDRTANNTDKTSRGVGDTNKVLERIEKKLPPVAVFAP